MDAEEKRSKTMLLRVGELAKRCGLTVRTLHYYDEIGLLAPSARSDAGYRLYNRGDIARLHQVQALRRLGVSLGEIGALLTRPELSLASVIEQQLRMLDEQIAQSVRLRDRLSTLRAQFMAGEEPELAEWLTTMELMNMYDKYFTQEELKQLPFYQADTARRRQWSALVEQVAALMAGAAPAGSEQAQALAVRWMNMVEQDTLVDPALFAKLRAMHDNEPGMQEQTGISPDMIGYVMRAFAESKLQVYQKYLSPAEFAFMRANYGKRMKEWPPLIAALRKQMDGGAAPGDAEPQRLAQVWMELFRSYAGDNPETQQKIRNAMVQEPSLARGTWLNEELLAYLRQALAILQPAS
jgi:DNA-binding transcriptional MerR regulator